jgi:hypothetical protein
VSAANPDPAAVPFTAIQAAVRAAAAAIANARGNRRGVPTVTNILEVLRDNPRTRKLYDEVMEDARAALAAAVVAPLEEEDELVARLADRLRKATPLPWRWWTSNSFRRLTGESDPRNRRDGSVLNPAVASDGHPDCDISAEDMALIEDAVNALPQLVHLATQVSRLRQWVQDLQSGLYVNCVYCGHRYGPGETTPVSMADALKAHVEACPEHPMAKLRTTAGELLDACEAAFQPIDGRPTVMRDLNRRGPDGADVMFPPSGITFGMIRRLRALIPYDAGGLR